MEEEENSVTAAPVQSAAPQSNRGGGDCRGLDWQDCPCKLRCRCELLEVRTQPGSNNSFHQHRLFLSSANTQMPVQR